MIKPKVAFVIGHNEKSKGAYSKAFQNTEFVMWNNFYDNHVCDLGDKFIHSITSSYTKRQTQTAIKTKDYDLVFELHFNSSSSTQAHGAEALVYHTNKKMAKVGRLFCELMASELGYRNRKVKLKKDGNGFGFLKETKGDAMILEPFFGSNVDDCFKFSPDEYRDIIIKTIEYYSTLK